MQKKAKGQKIKYKNPLLWIRIGFRSESDTNDFSFAAPKLFIFGSGSTFSQNFGSGSNYSHILPLKTVL